MDYISLKYVLNSLAFSGIGLAVFAAGFLLLDLATPSVSIWKELVEKQNVAMAVFLGAVAIAVALIVAASIHG